MTASYPCCHFLESPDVEVAACVIVLVTVPVVLVMTLLVTVLEKYKQDDGSWEFHHES